MMDENARKAIKLGGSTQLRPGMHGEGKGRRAGAVLDKLRP